MKHRFLLLLLLFFFLENAFSQQAERCGTRQSDGEGQHHFFPKEIKKTMAESRAVVNIPVVVHVVWNSSEENISDEQIGSQIEVLNKDFNAGNTEIGGVPAMFQQLIADVDFHFCLATKDPDGNPTDGITRTQTTNNLGIGGAASIHYTSQGGRDAWNPDKYLNIWVAKFAGGLGGVATFPGQGPAAEQGVEVNYKQFGTIGTATNPPYHLGRTCTHEIGHYFNLQHLWGPGISSCCNEDDGVADTPVSCEDYLHECPAGTTFSCAAPDMWMNFMNYTDDACMAMFSKGQKVRMYEALNDFRPGLLTSDGCTTVGVEVEVSGIELRILGNPVSGQLRFELKSSRVGNWHLCLYNSLGQAVFCEAKNANELDVLECSHLPGGIYFLVASQNGVRIAKRVVLN